MTKPNPYPKHSIGEHIIPFQLVFDRQDSVNQALSVIRNKVGSWPNTETVFVVDKENKLIGAVDFRKLVSSDTTKRLEDLMTKDFEALTDHSHQASAIKFALKKEAVNQGLESIPVTDQNGHFLGIIDAAQIFRIMHEEHIEKLMHFSGILNNEELIQPYKSSIFKAVKARLPWLLLGLLGGILATFMIKGFEYTLTKELTLAFFIPVIVYMNAAVGNQTQTIFVRYSSLEKVNFLKSFLYELKVSIIVATVLSLAIFIFSFFWLGMNVANIVSISMFTGVISSVMIGTLFPWILEKLGKDPAIGSGPFTTIIQDLLSIFIYFSIASALI